MQNFQRESSTFFTKVVEAALDSGNDFVISVNGGSMAPTIVRGDRLHGRILKGVPHLGEIVLCRDIGKKWLIHRVVAVTPWIRTKGDALSEEDLPIEEVAAVIYRIEKTLLSRLRRTKLKFKQLLISVILK